MARASKIDEGLTRVRKIPILKVQIPRTADKSSCLGAKVERAGRVAGTPSINLSLSAG